MRISTFFIAAFLLTQTEPVSAQKPADKPAYGKNIIAIAPLQMIQIVRAGLGLHYERQMDERGKFSFYLPVAFFLNEVGIRNNKTGVVNKGNRLVTYLYPGFKFYPAGSGHQFTYSMGGSLAIGLDYADADEMISPIRGPIDSWNHVSNTMAGFMFQNGLNIQATPKFYMGLELGLGLTFLASGSWQGNVLPIYQLNYKFGYRY